MNVILFRSIIALIVIIVLWTILTLLVEQEGPPVTKEFGPTDSDKKVLIVYDPDPIYNLDEQICNSLGKAIGESGLSCTVTSVAAVPQAGIAPYNCVIFCANTYNWRPDWAISNFIKKTQGLEGKQVVAICLGAGSTTAANAKLIEMLSSQGAVVLNNKEWWLMRPNDESRMEEKNSLVAVDQAYQFGANLANSIRGGS